MVADTLLVVLVLVVPELADSVGVVAVGVVRVFVVSVLVDSVFAVPVV